MALWCPEMWSNSFLVVGVNSATWDNVKIHWDSAHVHCVGLPLRSLTRLKWNWILYSLPWKNFLMLTESICVRLCNLRYLRNLWLAQRTDNEYVCIELILLDAGIYGSYLRVDRYLYQGVDSFPFQLATCTCSPSNHIYPLFICTPFFHVSYVL